MAVVDFVQIKRLVTDAVAWQLKALDLAAADEKANMRMVLELYEAGRLYHEE